MPIDRYTYRTLKKNPAEYEAALANSIIAILSRSLHNLPEIVQELNRTGPRPQPGGDWTEQNFMAQMERLGAYPNSTGAPLGTHDSGAVVAAAQQAASGNQGRPQHAAE